MEKKFLNFEVETNSNEEEDNKENNKEIKSVNKKCIIIIIASILLVIVIAVILLVVLLNNNNTSNTSNNPQNTKFYKTEITDDIFKRIYGKSFKTDCTLPREDLRYIRVLHIDINNKTHEGEMICNKYIADTLLKIFKKLYEEKYPIERMVLVDEYDADDEKAMEDNDSSCFNFRFISHTTRISKHGLGLAVDINTLYNPYIKVVDNRTIIEPITGEPYVDRNKSFIYKIEKNDLCYNLFIENGFEWGGNWIDRKDYQHFEIPDDKIKELYPNNI